MIASIVIGTLIFAYAGYVIFRKVREWKAGRFCSCGCESCQMKCYGRKQDGGNQ
ncbi:MAG: FeoB-associated Cys-rich membrane protein [Hominisplanchenecus sp.]